MRFENEPRQLDDEGNLGPVQDICIAAAQRVFLERHEKDTNPAIVQMILRGELVDHWYYRSDEHIDQPYFLKAYFLQPYRGPTTLAHPTIYGPGTYIIDELLTNLTKNGLSSE